MWSAPSINHLQIDQVSCPSVFLPRMVPSGCSFILVFVGLNGVACNLRLVRLYYSSSIVLILYFSQGILVKNVDLVNIF